MKGTVNRVGHLGDRLHAVDVGDDLSFSVVVDDRLGLVSEGSETGR